jgi:hypothetical protein
MWVCDNWEGRKAESWRERTEQESERERLGNESVLLLCDINGAWKLLTDFSENYQDKNSNL